MYNNYHAWQVPALSKENQASTNEVLVQCIRYASLAPSSHNSQPWEFRIFGSGIEAHISAERFIKHADKNGRQTRIGLGCAVQNILLAGSKYGFETTIDRNTGDIPIKISFVQSTDDTSDSTYSSLVHFMNKRVTGRGVYTDALPSARAQTDIVTYAKSIGLTLKFAADKSDLELISNILTEALTLAMNSIELREELASYLRSNITQEYHGIPTFGMGFGLIQSFIAPQIIRTTNIALKTQDKTRTLLGTDTPMVGVICSSEDSEVEWLNSGLLYQYTALRLGLEGFTVAPFAAAIEEPFSRNLLSCAVPSEATYPQMCFRIGIPVKATPHSPRLQMEAILKKS